MSSHTSRTFLNSCIKTPIDPCNRCPAPIYNRPKMYLGRLTGTPMTITTGTKYTIPTSRKSAAATETETENDTMWACSGVRSLAKLYDSIPDYCDINHLSEGEFYSTLNTLRSTCHELKIKPPPHCESSCSATTSTNTTTTSSSQKEEKKQKKKSMGKKKSCKNAESRKKLNSTQKSVGSEEFLLESSWRVRETAPAPCDVIGFEKTTLCRSTPLKSKYKQECEDEVTAFKRTLKEFEEELKRSSYTTVPVTPKSTTFLSKEKSANNLTKIAEDALNEEAERLSTKEITYKSNGPAVNVREKLKKSFSFNDIHSIAESDEFLNAKIHSSNINTNRLTKAEILSFRDRTKLSNYFKTKSENKTPASTPNDDLPKIVIDTPTSDTITSSGRSRKKTKSKMDQDDFKLPFPVFSFGESKKENVKARSVSPKHPVARPNLAATLRVEVSKKKLRELQNTCTYHDVTPTVDWEVRKTPAWKSLSLNESHKQILALRLATRKAEQDLQKREYDLNMELMRQRVKSAPLLLEGATYWGPNVGKLTHTCQLDGMKHTCQSSLRKQRKKTGRRTGGGGGSDCGIGCTSQMSNKLQSLRKIYASSAGTCSRQSQRSVASDGVAAVKQKRTARTKTPAPAIIATAADANDSGDELCSVDRAYL